jgi:hypothetical protein
MIEINVYEIDWGRKRDNWTPTRILFTNEEDAKKFCEKSGYECRYGQCAIK